MQTENCPIYCCCREVLRTLEERKKKSNKRNLCQRRRHIEALCFYYLNQKGYSLEFKKTSTTKPNEFKVLIIKNQKDEIIFNRKTIKEQAIINGLTGYERKKFIEFNTIRKLVREIELQGIFITFQSLRSSTDIAQLTLNENVEQQVKTTGKECFCKINELIEDDLCVIPPYCL
ncbi:hypothetical protein EDI_007650 [Entamoeba dispar SAW760]|uniref:Uncharacterized protein n=1 Tax=Entamoeba dispar (strain ATCC PRA-260 / SAW760) TaxID=370354 RepID=B0ECF6_ENTDS|nr:uncharacterized protein EDI_007650 [Entamoeba dispar SAW760]EDR27799.1 hypothetical protein EDI_007650 [Entamoeba dispar SAW760]|eukprot:EDR27799.1 hypothetical protein EDI_007650 [Entamoeba dispar SAW760]